jgi:DNA repair exonuclease SbcCD ATPase subunit
MAEVEKSIQISYKADLKDLTAKLKQIPNLTDQEARKMVSALDRQLKQAEKAAKKSSEASKKAAQQAAMAAARGQDFDTMADSARRAEERLERVGDASGDIDRGFSSIGLALRGVNPQLAEAADGIADAFAVTEGLTMSFAALNPLVIAATATIGTLTLGYMHYQQEIEKAKQLTLDMKEAQRSLNDSYKELRANFNDSLNKLGEIQDEYAVLTGQITEYELALRQTERNTKAMFQSNIDQQQTVIDQRKEELVLINSMMQANLGSIENAKLLSETEKERLNNLQLLTDGVNKSVDLTKHDLTLNNELAKIRNALTNEIATQEKAMEIIVGHQEQAVDLAMQIQEFENETARAKEKQVQHGEKKVEILEEEKDLLNDLMAAENRFFDRQTDARLELDKMAEDLLLNDDERKELSFQREMERIQHLGEVSGKQGLARELQEQKINEIRVAGMREAEKQMKKLTQISIQQGNEMFNSLGEFASAAMDLAKENGKENSKIMKVLFRMSQIAAVGEIGMKAATMVMGAMALPKGLRGIRIAAVTGAAAANAGMVMAQQPPQASFHMGGMAPDEMGARVLQGEAVLDRATVQRIGGEEGVQQLQEGNIGDSKVVVIQPFKHFGRFVKEIGFKAPTQTGLRAY